MEIRLIVNDEPKTWQAAPGESLRDLLRREGYLSVKYGCDSGNVRRLHRAFLDGRAVHFPWTIIGDKANGPRITNAERIGGTKNRVGTPFARESLWGEKPGGGNITRAGNREHPRGFCVLRAKIPPFWREKSRGPR